MKYSGYLLVGLLGFLFACNGNSGDGIEESGTIEATNILISSKVSGTVQKFMFEEGDKVEKSDTILIIDTELLDIQLKQAEALKAAAEAKYNLLVKGARKEDLSFAEEKLNQAKANFELVSKEMERIENLFNSKAVPKREYDQVTAKYRIAKSQLRTAEENFKKISNFARPEELKAAKANLQKANAQVDLIKKQISDCFVTSPVSGFIVNKFVEPGENVAPFTSLVKIADLTDVNLVIYIPETELGKVKLGQTAKVKTDTYPDKTYKGKVVYISPEAEFTPKSVQTKDERTKLVFAVKISIDNPKFELKAGMPADVVIDLNGTPEQ